MRSREHQRFFISGIVNVRGLAGWLISLTSGCWFVGLLVSWLVGDQQERMRQSMQTAYCNAA